MTAATRGAAVPGASGHGTQTEPQISLQEAKIWHERFSKVKSTIACPKCIEAAVDKDHTPTCGTLTLTPSSNTPLMVTCTVCKKATRSVKSVKIAITTAESKRSAGSRGDDRETQGTPEGFTFQQFQDLSLKVAQLTTQLSEVRQERADLEPSPTVPAPSAEDRDSALREEMVKMSKQIEELRAENNALRSHDPPLRPTQPETTTTLEKFMAQ